MRYLALLLVIGCKGSPPPASKEPPPAHPTAAPLIDLRPLTLTFGGRPIARLHADGRMESAGPNDPADGVLLPGPTLRGDGMILLKGGLTARLEPDGDIYIVNPPAAEQQFGRIADHRLELGSNNIGSIIVDGATIRYDRPTRNVIGTIEGAVDDRRRHTALVMTAAFFIDMTITKAP